MGKKIIEMAGRTYGFMYVIVRTTTNRCLCMCLRCTRIKEVPSHHLRSGDATACGCIRISRARDSEHPLYSIWKAIFRRCYDPKDGGYSRYGGRGIEICERWCVLQNFVDDMGPKPSESHTIDRVDNDGPYCPDNCKWATRTEQARNRRSNRLLTANGKTQCVAQWAEELHTCQSTLKSRINYGWTDEEIISGVRKKRVA